MKVLWIAPNGGNYGSNKIKGTGGWVAALQSSLVKNLPDIELGITFTSTDSNPVFDDRVSYFPIYVPRSNFSKWYSRFRGTEQYYENLIIDKIREVISSYSPDIIHIWGCENDYIGILQYLKCPYVVHIQGVASSYKNVFFPNGINESCFNSVDSFINTIKFKGWKYRYKDFLRRAAREEVMAHYVTNWIGRTEWDKMISYCLNPQAHYYHCDELLRDEFFSNSWTYHYSNTMNIMSTIGERWYKGIDVIIKTAIVLTKMNIKYEWNVYGISFESSILKYCIKKFNVNIDTMHVKCHGNVTSDILMEAMLDSDVYVHPSYIENSSNSIAEAMAIGVPVIAQFTGGNPTMLKEDSGVLVQPNDPYTLAYKIKALQDSGLANMLSEKSRTLAKNRNNPKSVVQRLYYIYNSIIRQDNGSR